MDGQSRHQFGNPNSAVRAQSGVEMSKQSTSDKGEMQGATSDSLTEIGSSAHPFMHNEDMNDGSGIDTLLSYDVNTHVYSNEKLTTFDTTIDMLAEDDTITIDVTIDVIVDTIHVYICHDGPKRRGNSSSTRVPNGIG